MGRRRRDVLKPCSIPTSRRVRPGLATAFRVRSRRTCPLSSPQRSSPKRNCVAPANRCCIETQIPPVIGSARFGGVRSYLETFPDGHDLGPAEENCALASTRRHPRPFCKLPRDGLADKAVADGDLGPEFYHLCHGSHNALATGANVERLRLVAQGAPKAVVAFAASGGNTPLTRVTGVLKDGRRIAHEIDDMPGFPGKSIRVPTGAQVAAISAVAPCRRTRAPCLRRCGCSIAPTICVP